MSKPYYAFCPKWFKKHQKKLLFLLNNKLLKYVSRYVLRIHNDLDFSENILEIRHNSYDALVSVSQEGGQDVFKIRSDVRTHAKFSKRIYNAFKPFWWTAHYMDEIFLDKYAPSYSFGFSTLTVYPDAGTGGTTVDGMTGRGGGSETFTNKRDNAGTYAFATDTNEWAGIVNGSTTTNEYDSMQRGIFLFDTSAIDSGSNIDSAILSLFETSNLTSLGDTTIDIVASSPASNGNLVSADYGTLGTTVYGDITISTVTAAAYNAITMNSSGRTAVNTTGITKFGSRLGFDTDDVDPTWSSGLSTGLRVNFADETGTSKDPKLVIEFSSPNKPIYFFS